MKKYNKPKIMYRLLLDSMYKTKKIIVNNNKHNKKLSTIYSISY